MHAELTQIPVSPRTRNILLAIVVGLIYIIFWKAPTLPKLLLSGMAVALVLSFPVKYLSKIIPRGIAIAIVVIALLALLVPVDVVEELPGAEHEPADRSAVGHARVVEHRGGAVGLELEQQRLLFGALLAVVLVAVAAAGTTAAAFDSPCA